VENITPLPPLEPDSSLSSSPAKSKLLIFLLAIAEIVTLLAAVYFAFKFFKLQENVGIPTPAPVEDKKDESKLNPPDGWEYKTSECAVEFPIPPKEEGNGRFWDFPRGAVYPNMLTKIDGTPYKQAIAMYASEEEASGYIDSAVAVSCMINGDGFSNGDLSTWLEERLKEYNESESEKGQEAQKYNLISKDLINKWGKEVWEFKVEEEFKNDGGDPFTLENTYYLFSTMDYIYELRMLGASEDDTVRETASKILNGLQFK
jgi:hypothetical protein